MFDFRDLWCYLLKRANNISSRECEILSKKGEEMKRAVVKLITSDFYRSSSPAITFILPRIEITSATNVPCICLGKD